MSALAGNGDCHQACCCISSRTWIAVQQVLLGRHNAAPERKNRFCNGKAATMGGNAGIVGGSSVRAGQILPAAIFVAQVPHSVGIRHHSADRSQLQASALPPYFLAILLALQAEQILNFCCTLRCNVCHAFSAAQRGLALLCPQCLSE